MIKKIEILEDELKLRLDLMFEKQKEEERKEHGYGR